MKVKVVAKGNYGSQHKESPLLKAKIFYFSNDWEESCENFIEENKERGYDLNMDDIACYTWD